MPTDLSILIPPEFFLDHRLGTPTDAIHLYWHPAALVPSAEAAEFIDDRWNEYLAVAHAAGKTLFNGPITRLLRAARRPDHHIELHLGPADYKTFLVTCMRDHTWFLQHAPEVIAPALGNSTLLTRGDACLLGLRSQKVSCYPGRGHLFGGVLDGLGMPADAPRFPASALGLVQHLQLELHEEAAISAVDLDSTQAWPRMLALLHDDFYSQPEAVWQWELATELETIAQRLDPDEHSGYLIVEKNRMTDALWRQLTPVARQTWHMWSQRT